MRLYTIKIAGGPVCAYAGTMADARAKRTGLVESKGVKKKDILIDEIDVPTGKQGLLVYLNDLVARDE